MDFAVLSRKTSLYGYSGTMNRLGFGFEKKKNKAKKSRYERHYLVVDEPEMVTNPGSVTELLARPETYQSFGSELESIEV
jgi:hypothetical protein